MAAVIIGLGYVMNDPTAERIAPAPRTRERRRPAPQAGLEQFIAVASLFDAAEMVLYVADMDTHELLFMNAFAERIWGDHHIGEPCWRVLQTGQSGPCAFCTNDRLRDDDGTGHPVVWEFQNTFNKRWYLCIDKAIPWPGRNRVRMEVAIDTTERKLTEQFHQQYLALISHDLRSPLSTIDLSASVLQLLHERAGLGEAKPHLASIQRGSRRMAGMIEDLLETTRLESGQLVLHTSSFDLGQLAWTVADQFGGTTPRRLRCEASGPTPVVADADRIERVLENLIGNALRYSPLEAPVQVSIDSGEREAVVTVVDHGLGIPPDELPRLFERFYRASCHRQTKGLGLGLYNSRLIIEQHGGRIWATSGPGGSTFRFSLPVS